MRHHRMTVRALSMALALVLLPLAGALAEQVDARVLEGFAAMHPVNGTYVLRLPGSEAYAVFSADGEQISTAYRQIEARQDIPYYIVTGDSPDGMNARGLVDGSGREIVPAAYGFLNVVSDRWILACVLADWSTVASTDVYFDGEKIGTLGAEDYAISSYATAHGAYLGIGGQQFFYLSSRFERVPCMMDYLVQEEFFYNWNDGGIYHPGTGQRAFEASCTLTADEVERKVWYDDRGDFIDLQGQVVTGGPSGGRAYDDVSYAGGDYLLLRSGNRVGMADMRGEEVLPADYDALGGDTRSYFAMGYQAVLRDGALAWVDRDGRVTASATGVMNAGDLQGFQVNGLFAVNKAQGEAVIFTAAAGELPQRYEDAVAVTSPRQRILCVKRDGLWGAINMNGDVVIPLEHAGPLQISQDGTLAIGQNARQEQVAYAVAYGDAPAVTAPPAAPAGTPVPAVSEAPAPAVTEALATEADAAEEGGWVCSTCQRTLTLNFCPYDGTARPEEPPVCASCGYELPAGNDFIFCPNCGATLQGAAD